MLHYQMTKLKQCILATFVVVALAACQHEGAPTPESATSAASREAPAPLDSSQWLRLEPSTLNSCESRSVIKITWDATKLADNSDLQLWIIDDGEEKLFVAGGASGTATTGPWIRPGVDFLLKSASNGAVIARAKIGGPPC